MKLTIGEVAKLFQISAHTLRYYDDEGLVRAKKNTQNGYRFYTLEEIEQLEQVLFFRSLDIPIEEIKKRIQKSSLESIEEMLGVKEELIDKEVKKLLEKKNKIKHMRSSINNANQHVGVLSKRIFPRVYGVYLDSEVPIEDYRKVSRQIDYDWLIHSTNTMIFNKQELSGEYLWGLSNETPLEIKSASYREMHQVEAYFTSYIGTFDGLREFLKEFGTSIPDAKEEIIVFEIVHFVKNEETHYVYEIWLHVS